MTFNEWWNVWSLNQPLHAIDTAKAAWIEGAKQENIRFHELSDKYAADDSDMYMSGYRAGQEFEKRNNDEHDKPTS